MRKLVTLFLVMVMALSVFNVSTLAKGNSGKENKGSSAKTTTSTSKELKSTKKTSSKNVVKATEEASENTSKLKKNENVDGSHGKDKKQNDQKKQFRVELNEQKKELQKQKTSLNQQKEELEAQYEAMIASGDTAGAEAALENLNALNEQMLELKAQIKKTINERYMVVKTMYSDAELEQFDSASDLVAQMYEDAYVLDAGCVTVNNNIIKFDAPAYLKGGVTLVPLRAISEELGGEVSWDGETNKVTITKDDTVIEITANSTTVLVDGIPVEISNPAEITCSRTYLPLRFLAETLKFNVAWDGENEIIDIDDESTGDDTTVDETVTDDTTDDTATDETATDDTTDDAVTDETATDDTTDDAVTDETITDDTDTTNDDGVSK